MEENQNVEETKNEIQENNELEQKNVELQKEVDESNDRLKRIMAEFENYKKRNQKEKELQYNSILADVINSLLPVIDNLEKAAEAKTEDENYKQGLELVLKQFKDVLIKFGVEEIKTVGETFDPEVHEAVSSVQDETKGEKEIVQEFRKGYKIKTKVIRHAMVVVAN